MKGKHTPPPPQPLGKFALFHLPRFSLPFLSYPSPKGCGRAPAGTRHRPARGRRGWTRHSLRGLSGLKRVIRQPETGHKSSDPDPHLPTARAGWSQHFGSAQERRKSQGGSWLPESQGCLQWLLAREQQGLLLSLQCSDSSITPLTPVDLPCEGRIRSTGLPSRAAG